MRSILLAFQFLTIFRISKRIEFQPQDFLSSLRWFFVIGLFIGVVQWGFSNLLLKFHFPSDVSALLIVIAGVILTGGLHLDGLADVADGFGAGHDRDSVLRIMKDERTGVYGIAAIVLGLIAKILAFVYVFNWESLSP